LKNKNDYFILSSYIIIWKRLNKFGKLERQWKPQQDLETNISNRSLNEVVRWITKQESRGAAVPAVNSCSCNSRRESREDEVIVWHFFTYTSDKSAHRYGSWRNACRDACHCRAYATLGSRLDLSAGMSIAISQRRQPPFMRFPVHHPQIKLPSRIVRVDSRRSPVRFDGESRVSCQKSWRVLLIFFTAITTQKVLML